MQLELILCKDEEKRRELQERLKEYDEVSINVIMYRPVDHYLQLYPINEVSDLPYTPRYRINTKTT